MKTISQAEEFYKELSGEYTIDAEHMFELVEADYSNNNIIVVDLKTFSDDVSVIFSSYFVYLYLSFNLNTEQTTIGKIVKTVHSIMVINSTLTHSKIRLSRS